MPALNLSSRRASSRRSAGVRALMAVATWSARAARAWPASARPASERYTRVRRWSASSARRSTNPAFSIVPSMRLSVGAEMCIALARSRWVIPSLCRSTLKQMPCPGRTSDLPRRLIMNWRWTCAALRKARTSATEVSSRSPSSGASPSGIAQWCWSWLIVRGRP